MSTPITLPADVYDTLEFSALAFGGIGAFEYFRNGPRGKTPWCAIGHVRFATGDENSEEARRMERLMDRCVMAARGHCTESENDAAFGSGRQIPFAAWCKRLNVVKGT